MNAKDREIMMQKIKAHGEILQEIFGLTGDPIALSKKARRIEVKANTTALKWGNADIDEDEFDAIARSCLKALNKLTGYRAKGVPVFLNSDARGYALKIESEYVSAHDLAIEKDMGGYGLIAPDFTPGGGE